MSAPTGQPAPFDPSALPVRPARPKPTSRRLLLPIAGGVAIAVLAFGAGYAAANALAPQGRSTAFNGNGGQFFGPGASARPRAGAFGGGASGTVGTVSANQMTITTASGGSRIVLLTPTTTVTQVSSTTEAVSAIASGQTVTVVGSSNPDGSVTATQVIIGNLSVFGGRGFGGGPEASTAPGQ